MYHGWLILLMLVMGTANAVSITPMKAKLTGKAGTSVELVFTLHGGETAERIALVQLSDPSESKGKLLSRAVLGANKIKSFPISFKLRDRKQVFVCAELMPLESTSSSASFRARTCSRITLMPS